MHSHLGYSPNGEDVLLADIFGCHSGTMVDVGAGDGVTDNHSYLLELLGWRCILVESESRLHARIQGSRESTCYHCVLGAWDGDLAMHTPLRSEGNAVAEGPGHLAIGRVAAAIPVRTHAIVRRRRLDTILEQSAVRRVDVVSISERVNEQNVLRGFCIARWAPRVVLVASECLRSTQNTSAILSKVGYCRFRRTGHTDWYAQATDERLVSAHTRFRTIGNDLQRAFAECLQRRRSLWSGVASNVFAPTR